MTLFVALASVMMAGPAAALGGPVSIPTAAAAAGTSSRLDLGMVAIVSAAVAVGPLWRSAPRLRRWRDVGRFRAELRVIDPVLACRPVHDDDPDRPATTI